MRMWPLTFGPQIFFSSLLTLFGHLYQIWRKNLFGSIFHISQRPWYVQPIHKIWQESTFDLCLKIESVHNWVQVDSCDKVLSVWTHGLKTPLALHIVHRGILNLLSVNQSQWSLTSENIFIMFSGGVVSLGLLIFIPPSFFFLCINSRDGEGSDFQSTFRWTNKPSREWFICEQIKGGANVKILFVLRHTGAHMHAQPRTSYCVLYKCHMKEQDLYQNTPNIDILSTKTTAGVGSSWNDNS